MPTLFSQLEVDHMPLVLSQSKIGPVTLLELTERLTMENVPELRDTLQSLADQGHRDLLLDCSHVTAVDSQGIGSLVGNWVSLKNRGGKLKLLHPSARSATSLADSGPAQGHRVLRRHRSSPAFLLTHLRHSVACLPSNASKRALASSPPANPVNLPVEPITRWHGAIMEMGFFPLAAPTARTALGFWICFAICP